jgi:hypothetical protein
MNISKTYEYVCMYVYTDFAAQYIFTRRKFNFISLEASNITR